MPDDTKEFTGLTEEQRELRRKLITASDVAAICGLDPWRTKYDVYASKVLGVEQPQTFRMERGHALEPLGIRWLSRQHAGARVVHNRETAIHPVFPWLGATTDGLFYEREEDKTPSAVVDVKAVGLGMSPTWREGAEHLIVPEHVHVQLQTQMIVKGLKRGIVVAMLDTEEEPEALELEHDDDLAGVLLEECDRFRVDHLEAKVPPPIDGSKSSAELVKRLFPKATSKNQLVWTPDIEDIAQKYLDAHRAEKDAKEQKQKYQALLCAKVGELEGVAGKNWRMTWKWREESVVPSYTRAGYRHFDMREIGKKKEGKAA